MEGVDFDIPEKDHTCVFSAILLRESNGFITYGCSVGSCSEVLKIRPDTEDY